MIDPANPQAFTNSTLTAMFEERQKEQDSPLDTFFGEKAPNLRVEHEKPEHRLMLYMKAQGASNRDIAKASGYSEAWVSQLMRQPWVRERLIAIFNEAGQDEVTSLIKGAAADSVTTLIDLRDDPNVTDAVRRQAADSLLDRYLGKPTQHVETRVDVAPDVTKIDEELSRLTAEENRLLGKLL
jgi:lambda repressor-like predicted transcriptional regulator